MPETSVAFGGIAMRNVKHTNTIQRAPVPARDEQRRSPLIVAATALIGITTLLFAGTCESTDSMPDRAPAPQSPLTHESHPFILLTTNQVASVRERKKRPPAKAWFDQLQARCSDGGNTQTPNDASSRLSLARDAALCYILTGDTTKAERAAKLLAALPLLDDAVNTNSGFHTFVGHVPRYCEAYDLLKTSSAAENLTWRIEPDDEAAIRNHIASMARWLHDNRPFWYDFARNNWAIRQYAALAIATMTIADGTPSASPDELRHWFDYARDETLRSLDTQVCAEGAFAEGCGYMNYAAENYLPMFFAMRNLLGDDWFALPRFRTNFEWLTKIRMPAGRLPNFDDAPLGNFPTHYLTSAYPDAGLFEWDWQRAGAPATDLCRTICWHDDSVTPKPPDVGPCIVLPKAGNAVLRSSSDADAVYLLLLGEHGQPRTAGFGHEHPDNTSFMIEAFGEQLAIDSGYIDFANHTLVNKPDSHNLILIDGAGPALLQVGNQPLIVDQDAYLENAIPDGPVPQCSVRTSYAGINIRRTIFMPGHDHFVIVDSIRPAEPAPPGAMHKFSWLLHGNAGVSEPDHGTGGSFEMLENSARWTRPSGITLQAWLTSTAGPPKIQERFDTDGETYRNQLTGHGPTSILRHRTIEGVIEGDAVTFLSILAPARDAEALPSVQDHSTDGNLSFTIQFPGNGRTETVTVEPDPSQPPAVTIKATAPGGSTRYDVHRNG